MQVFGKGFRQAIGQGFGHDRIVVVMIALEALAEILDSKACAHRKCAQEILQSWIDRSDEIGKWMIELARIFLHLLAKEMKGREHARAAGVGVELNVIADCISREEAENTTSG